MIPSKNGLDEADVEGDIEQDRVFVINFEPNPPIRYVHFKLDVFNVSSTTTKYVHYFEIRRRVYRELTNVNVSTDIADIISGETLTDQPTSYLKGGQEGSRRLLVWYRCMLSLYNSGQRVHR